MLWRDKFEYFAIAFIITLDTGNQRYVQVEFKYLMDSA